MVENGVEHSHDARLVGDLVEVSVKQVREAETRKVRDRAADAAEDRVLDVLIPPAREVNFSDMQPTDSATRRYV